MIFSPGQQDLGFHNRRSGEVPRSKWDRVANSSDFKNLVRKKKLFIIPTLLFFLAYTLSYPILAGIAPRFMSIKVFGEATVIYIFSISEFFLGWLVAWRYALAAARFDDSAKEIVQKTTEDCPGE